jgi:cobalt-zinc-cadmium efflux system outer membrane protein
VLVERWSAALLAMLALLPGCGRNLRCDAKEDQLSTALSARMGVDVVRACPGNYVLPNGAALEDGISEDEAIALALWNNASFHELLVDLDLAHADLVQAGLLPNPELVYFFPVSEKPYKYLFDFPLESLWLRPIRISNAALEQERTVQRLTQAGLDLIRDVRQAYADSVLAERRLEVIQNVIHLRAQIARIAEARVEAGDAGAQEAATAKIDLLAAQQDFARIQFEVSLAQERLRNLLGLGWYRAPLKLSSPPVEREPPVDTESLVAEALDNRPDMLAANEAVAAAEARERLARIGWFRILGILPPADEAPATSLDLPSA